VEDQQDKERGKEEKAKGCCRQKEDQVKNIPGTKPLHIVFLNLFPCMYFTVPAHHS